MDDEDKQKLLSGFETQDGCWIWTRGCAKGGYGAVFIGGKTRRAHRACYELIRGVTLTPDQFLHHICNNKACINPFHLEITNQADHVDSATFGNKEKTRCPYGHEYTPENTRWNRGGKSRECYQCKLLRMRRKRLRLKQATNEKLKALAIKCSDKMIQNSIPKE
jgi:hypothetical protein